MFELFKTPKIDWIGKKPIFIAISVVLLVAGAISVVIRGFNPGIDFAGGALAYVSFKEKPTFDAIRNALTQQGIDANSIVLQDISGGLNQVLIRLPREAAESQEEGIDTGKKRILAALRSLSGTAAPVDNDINSLSRDELQAKLRDLDPLGIASQGAAGEQKYKEVADHVVEYRNDKSGGLLNTPADVPLTGEAFNGVDEAQKTRLRDTLNGQFVAGNFNVVNVESVSAAVGAELRARAIYVTMAALFGMLIYIAFRFEWIYGLSAVIAVFHDVMVTLGVFSILQKEIDLTVIAALLTLVGYSMNDTIVIFDRVRELLKLRRKDDLVTVVNDSINQTLSRSVLTSGLTLLAVTALLLFGGPVLNGFALALFIGVIVGSYSTIAVAGPIMLWWKRTTEQRARRALHSRVSPGSSPVKAK